MNCNTVHCFHSQHCIELHICIDYGSYSINSAFEQNILTCGRIQLTVCVFLINFSYEQQCHACMQTCAHI